MTKNRIAETRMLNLLRKASNANQFVSGIDKRYLSPEGRIILRAIIHLLTLAGKYDTLSLEDSDIKLSILDVWLSIKELYPHHDLASIKEILETFPKHKADFEQPGVVAAIFDQEHKRMILTKVISEASDQTQSHNFDLERLKDLVTNIDSPGKRENRIAVADFSQIPDLIDRDRIGIGLSGVDKSLQGGLGRGELGVIGGFPKYGKTSLLLNIAGNELKRGYPVLYITLADLSKGELLLRVACWFYKKPEEYLLSRPYLLERLNNELDKRDIHFIPIDMQDVIDEMSVDVIQNMIMETKKEYPDLRLVLIDRGEMLAYNASDRAHRHSIVEVYRDLRKAAKVGDVAVWADSQVGYTGKNKKVVTMDMAHESKVGKAQVLDVWVGIGNDMEDKYVRYLTLEGRRRIKQRVHQVRFSDNDFRYREEYLTEDL